jgi:tRNA(Ile)-lysidine synthase
VRLDPAVADQRRAVRAALADLPPGSTVLVGCSGGADSLALAAALAFVAPREGWRAGAVVVDHGLQPGSAGVAGTAARQCAELGLDPVEVVAVDVGADGGPEAAARAARYQALGAAAERHGGVAVLLGHTLDDQAETVLLGLARGSGSRSLAGMAPVRGLLRRPFLGVRRVETARACAVLGLDPWHDPTNGPGADPAALPARSRLRHEALPVLEAVLGPGVAEALARTAGQLREDADVLDDLAERLRAVASGPDGSLDPAVLEASPAALRRRALRAAAVAAGVPAGSLTRTHVLAMDALVADWHGQGSVGLPGAYIARRCGRLTVTPG